MAKRTAEESFRPLDLSLVSSVLSGNSSGVGDAPALPDEKPQVPSTTTNVVQYPQSLEPPKLPDRLEREKRVLLSIAEERAVQRVVTAMGLEIGSTLKLSHVLRACVRLIVNAEAELIERARAKGRTIRPPNSDLAGIENFERHIASVLHTALKNSRPVR